MLKRFKHVKPSLILSRAGKQRSRVASASSLSVSLSLAFLVVSLFVPFSAFAAPSFADTKGDFEVIDNTSDASSVYSFANDVLTIESGDVTLSTTKQTNQRIVVGTANTTGEVKLHLDSVDIQTSSGHALQILDNATFNVGVEIPDGTESILDASQANNCSGIEKYCSDSLSNPGTLTLYGKGELIAKGGENGCGIGTATDLSYSRCSNISIQGVTIEAEGKGTGAGIGVKATGTSLMNCSIENAHISAKGMVGIGASDTSFINSSIRNSTISAWGYECGIGVNIYKVAISNSTIVAYSSQRNSVTNYGAGIGGGIFADGSYGGAKEVNISDSIIYAYGGKNSSGNVGAGIGGVSQGGQSSNNSISGNSLIYAASGGDSIDALQGFDTSNLTGGIVFEGVVSSYTDNPFENPYEVTWNKGTIYGETTLSKAMAESLELPATTTIDTNATFKVAADSHLTIPNAMSLQNDGKLSSLDNITIESGGSITTANNFYLKDATSPSTSNYATYLTHTGIIQKYTAVPAFPQNYIHGWFSNKDGTGVQVYNGKQVELNTHNFYEVESDAYQIQVPDVEHGTVNIDKDYAYQGDKVSFTLVPDEGYTVESVSVATKDGTTLPLDTTGDTYSFAMPGSEVTVNVTFVADGPTPPGPTPPGPTPEPTPDPTPDVTPTSDTSALLPITGDMHRVLLCIASICVSAAFLGFVGVSKLRGMKRPTK